METKDLRIFQAVAREGSVTKAAEVLNYVQSNVTNRIQYLEAQLKVPLFYRSNRGMSLTAPGEKLLDYANDILALIEEAVKSTTQYTEHPSGPLRLGSIETAAAHHLTQLLKDYHCAYPDVELSLTTNETHQLLHMVIEHKLDGAFVYGPIHAPDIHCISAFEDELVLISEPDKHDVSYLLTKPMLLFDVGCTHRTKMEDYLRDHGIVHDQLMAFGTLEVIINGVAAGLGVSLLPQSSVINAEKMGKITSHRLPEAYRHLEICFIHRKDSFYSSALSKLVQCIESDVGQTPSYLVINT